MAQVNCYNRNEIMSNINIRLKKLKSKINNENLFEGHFWVFTDSHVDIDYRHNSDPASFCHNISLNNMTKKVGKFGHVDCDASSDLLMSAFNFAKKIDSNIDFIIWLGDAVSHGNPGVDAIVPVNRNFSQELRKHFPNTLIIPVLGNHDTVLKVNRSKRFIEFYNNTKYNLLLNDENARQTFIKGGYYSLRYETLKEKNQNILRFIVLNTAMFQPQYSDYFYPNESIEQIEWFNKTMSDAYNLNDRILLLIHVPFGLCENGLYKYYDIRYEQRILSIIDKYSSNIIMCLTGHRHRDIFRIYSTSNTTMGILSHPSISPISYLSHPSIRKYSYNRKSLVLTDYEQYSLNLFEVERTQKDQWTLSYRFSSWYRQSKELTSKNLFHLVHLIRKNAFYLKRFLLTKHHAENVTLTNHNILQALCAITLFNFDEFLLCVRRLENKNIQYGNLIINNSLEINVYKEEQLVHYRIIYKRVAIGLSIFIIIILCIIYQIYMKYFYNIVNEKNINVLF